MGAVATGAMLVAGAMALGLGSVPAAGPGDGAVGQVITVQSRRDWNDKDWDKGREGRGRRATSNRERRAFDFITEFYRRSTESTPDAYRFVAAAYAPEVSYYGKSRSREGVLADKFAWMERWPVRDYRVQEDSAEWQCNENARLCVVRVLIDFDARNPKTGKVSKGVTTNELGVRVSNSDVEIEYENGKVLSRK
ncbi:MAG: hypothetical protein ACT4N2_14780 [Hyphomicrobium sp.]